MDFLRSPPLYCFYDRNGGAAMRKPMTEDEMRRDIRRSNRFNMIAFIITMILTAAAIISFFCLDRYIILMNIIK